MSDEADEGQYDIVLVEGMEPIRQRMIVVKLLANGDMHAENDEGEMVMVRTDGTVKTFLEGDTNWVNGRTSNPATAWEIIGFHFNMTNGYSMERTRNERTS